jgi:large subunit ribosomal protein L5
VRLRERYEKEVRPALTERFGYRNPMQVPRLHKVVLNMGVGEAVQNPRVLDGALKDLATISGQKAVVTRAKKSIASFKIRTGMPIGCMVTLRGQRMWDFLERLISFALPRVRDFRGLSPKGFDGRGNYSLGLREQIIFPEIAYEEVEQIRGLDVAIVTTARTDEEGRELLRLLGMPLRET